jgi:hypothetical protein
VVTACDHLQKLKFSKALPYAFTEHGAISRRQLSWPPDDNYLGRCEAGKFWLSLDLYRVLPAAGAPPVWAARRR